jgi:hypothetical protein
MRGFLIIIVVHYQSSIINQVPGSEEEDGKMMVKMVVEKITNLPMRISVGNPLSPPLPRIGKFGVLIIEPSYSGSSSQNSLSLSVRITLGSSTYLLRFTLHHHVSRQQQQQQQQSH